MIKIPENKIYNAYMVETKDLDGAIDSIKEYIGRFGFDEILLRNNTHPDFMVIELENKDVREKLHITLMSKVSIKPNIADRRVFIIYSKKDIPVHIQNMLLKTLEEPPEYVSIFIITESRDYFLDTIKSRVFLIRDFSDTNDAIELDDKVKDKICVLISDIRFKDAFDIIDFSKENHSNIKNILKFMLYVARDSLYYKKTYDKNRLYSNDRLAYIEAISDNYRLEDLGVLIKEIEESMLLVSTNVDKELMLENIFYNVRNSIIKE